MARAPMARMALAGLVVVGCAAAPEVELDPGGTAPAGSECAPGGCGGPPIEADAEVFGKAPPPQVSITCDESRVCASGSLIPARPRVLLLVDRSGSMTYELSPGQSRWRALGTALTGPSGVIPAFEQDVEFGLSFYTYRGVAEARCETLSPPVWSGWAEAFSQTQPVADGQTPTAQALTQAALELERFDASAPRAILLATDGMPDTCTEQKVDTHGTLAEQQAVQAQVVQTVTDIYAAGITTYVVGVGPATQLEHLRQVANAGLGRLPGAPGPDAEVYQVGDEAELRTAFDNYVSSLRSCLFLLDADVESVAHATLTVGGDVAVYGSDWQLNGTREVQLLGSACDRVKLSGSAVEIEVPCGCE